MRNKDTRKITASRKLKCIITEKKTEIAGSRLENEGLQHSLSGYIVVAEKLQENAGTGK